MRQRLASLFHIQAGEGHLVVLTLLFSFCIGIARTFTGTVARPLFLVIFDAQTLPYLYAGSAVAVSLVGYAYARLEARLALSWLVLATLALLTLSLGFFRVGLDYGEAPWLVMALSIWLELMWMLTSLAFWGPAGRLFNVRQSKRLFGLIGAGELVAVVIAGLLTPSLVTLIGTHNLLWVATGGLAGALLMYALIAYFYAARLQSAKAPARIQGAEGGYRQRADRFSQKLGHVVGRRPEGTPSGVGLPNDRRHASVTQMAQRIRPGYRQIYRELVQQRYIVLMFGFSILSLLGFYVLDNVFYDLAALRYPDEDQLASFVGLFLAASGFLALIARAFISAPLINRYGLLLGLLALPVLNGAGAAAVALNGTLMGLTVTVFWLATMTKMFDKILSQSISQTSFLILYQPLPVEQRLRVQTAIEGIVEPLAGGLAGISLIVLNTLFGFGAIQLSYVLVVILIGLLVITLQLNWQYPGALMKALSGRKLEGLELSLEDSSSVAVLQRGLHNPHAGVVLYSLNMLEEIEHESLPSFLQDLIVHPAPEVRQEVLRRIERLEISAALEAVRERVHSEDSPVVRGAALRTLAALADADVFEQLFPYLDDPEPALRLGALVGLLRSGGIEGVLAAGEKLIELIHAADADDRALAAHVLGEVGISSFYRPLLDLLRDPDPAVSKAALAATTRLNNPRLWPPMIELLAVPQVRTEAVAALVAAGEAVIPELRAVLAQPDLPLAVREKIIRVCGRIKGPAVVALLSKYLDDPEPAIYAQVLMALNRCGYQAADAELPLIYHRLRGEVTLSRSTLAALVDLGDDQRVALVRSALSYGFEQSRERMLLLLSGIYDPQSIGRARENLAHALPERRAYAVEIIDLLLDQAWKPTLLPLFDELEPRHRLQRLQHLGPHPALGLFTRLTTLAKGSGISPWIRACALYALRQVDPEQARLPLLAALQDAELLVLETAVWTLFELDPTALHDYCAQAGPALDPVVRRLGLDGATPMLSTIEKVLILKTISIFASIPDEILAEVAMLLEEVDLADGVTLFHKGDLGTSLYVIASGRVRIHDGDRTLNELGEGEVFGEQAVLDTAPRLASVTALETTRLLLLDQDPLYQLMSDRIEVVRSIIRVLSSHLRARVEDIAILHTRIEALTTSPTPEASA